jgi:preprotein translocase subunit Sec63
MEARFDPFEVLGVRPDATLEQIRSAYREQVARYHPDKHRGNPLEELAAARLVEINRAYDILSDEAKRAAYQAGSRRTSAPPASPGTTWSGGRGVRTPAEVALPSGGMKIIRSIGLLVVLVFFLRFGLALGREILVLVRGFVIGVLWLLRLNPIFAIAVTLAIALLVGFLFRTRKGNG